MRIQKVTPRTARCVALQCVTLTQPHLNQAELNGDWERFCAWAHQRHHERLRKRQRVKILTDQPLDLAAAA